MDRAKLTTSQGYEDGVFAGRGWGSAEVEHLRRVERLSQLVRGGLVAWALAAARRARGRGLGWELGRALLGQVTQREAAFFWLGVLAGEKSRVDDPAFASGFLAGALQVWGAMKDKEAG